MTNSIVYFNFLLTIVSLLIPALLALIHFVSSEKIFPYYSQERSAYIFVLVSLAVALYLNLRGYGFEIYSLKHGQNSFYLPFISYLSTSVIVDPLSSVTRSILLLVSFIATLFSFTYHRLVKYNVFEFSFYILLSTAAALVFVSSSNAVLTYVSVELQSLSFYLMATSLRKSVHSVEAGLKYIFIGSLASGILLFSFIYLYFTTGSLNFYEMGVCSPASRLGSYTYGTVGASALNILRENTHLGECLFIFAILIKMAAGPFHLWAVDVYEGSPSAATGFFLLVPKVASLVVLFRFSHDFFSWNLYSHDLVFIFSLVIALTFVLGYTGMISRHLSLKRFFTFSAIANLGFLLLPSISEGQDTNSTTYCGDSGIYDLFMYLLPYTALTVPCLALLLSFVSQVTQSGRQEHYVLANLPHQYHIQNPAHALLVFLLLITLIGLPPTVGFFMKLFPLVAYADGGYGWITLFLWSSLLVSAYVYAELSVRLFFVTPDLWNIESWKSTNLQFKHYSILLISAVVLIYFSFYLGQSNFFEIIPVFCNSMAGLD